MNKDRYQIDGFFSALKKAKRILLLSHVYPDGDTLGSSLALRLRLERMGYSVQNAVDGIINESLSFLPYIQELINDPAKLCPFDTVISVDVSSLDRLGCFRELFERCPSRLVIDHHETNPGFGQIQVIDEDAPATGVILYRLMEETGLPLTLEESICLYAAISTDTGNFVYSNTTPEAFFITGKLIEAGLPLSELAEGLFREHSIGFIRLLRIALSKQYFLSDERIACMSLTRRDLEAAGVDESYRDGIIDYGIHIHGVNMAYLACETENGDVKISFRSKAPCDIGKLARKLGGGGHAQAAGVTLRMSLQDAISMVEKEMRSLLLSQMKNFESK